MTIRGHDRLREPREGESVGKGGTIRPVPPGVSPPSQRADGGTDARDTVTIRWTGEDGRPRRLQFEPRAAGGWTRIEQRWTGDAWATVGQEIVSDVGVTADPA